MISRISSFLALLLLFVSTQAFAPVAFAPRTASVAESSITALDACRVNAKKEKRKRNRENMRKFSSGGRGTSRRKLLKKAQASKERQIENEFIAKCFITTAAPGAEES